MEELRRLGARSVPVLSRGDDWIFAQNLRHVVEFIGLQEDAGPVLPPAALIERLQRFMGTACVIVPQMPGTLAAKDVPNRPRSYFALAHHLFRIPEGMLEVAAGATLTNHMLTGGPPPEMTSFADIGDYGTDVLQRLTAWWHAQPDPAARQAVQTYYGPQTLHELLERTTWHCGQHVRQWFMLLGMEGIEPAAKLDDSAFASLPMPSSVWDG